HIGLGGRHTRSAVCGFLGFGCGLASGHVSSPLSVGSSVGWFGRRSWRLARRRCQNSLSLANSSESIRGGRNGFGDFQFMAELGLLPFTLGLVSGLHPLPSANEH